MKISHGLECEMGQFQLRDKGFSLKIIFTIKHLATLHPKVPAPNKRHFVLEIFSRSSSGRSLHLINFKFRSTADSDNL